MFLIIFGFLGLGISLVTYLLRHDHGRKILAKALWAAAGFGMLALIVAGFVELKLFPERLLTNPSSMPLGPRLLLFLAVGVVEEMVKFVPLAWFIHRKSYFKEHTDGVIYFAICGLTFGLAENILYTLTFGSSVGIARLLITPFFHAACTSILGFYLARAKIDPAYRGRFILALILIPLLHGVYDFGLYSAIAQLIVLSLMLTVAFTLGLFLYFMYANELDQTIAAKAVLAHPNFCIACGTPNTRHTAFCEHCGRMLQ